MFKYQLVLFVYSPLVLLALREAKNQLVLKHILLILVKVSMKVPKGLSIYSILALHFYLFL